MRCFFIQQKKENTRNKQQKNYKKTCKVIIDQYYDNVTRKKLFIIIIIMTNPQEKIKSIMVDVKHNENETCYTRYGHSIYHYKWDDSRYRYDNLLKKSDWRQQYDTEQDAHYFGIRVNVKLLMVIEYAEWDLYIYMAKDCDAMKAKLEKLAEQYGEQPPAMVAYDANWNKTELYDERPTIY